MRVRVDTEGYESTWEGKSRYRRVGVDTGGRCRRVGVATKGRSRHRRVGINMLG